MAHDHSDHDEHSHAHNDQAEMKAAPQRPLVVALGITVTVLVVEAVGGLLTGSSVLLADAGHMATDVIALALAVFAGWRGVRRRQYGRSASSGPRCWRRWSMRPR